MTTKNGSQFLYFDAALLADGWARSVRMEIAGGQITAIDTGVQREYAELAYGVAIPGLVNLHSHAFQRGMAGLAETRGPASDSFWTWRDVMYRFLARMSPDDCEAIAALAYMEMLEAGFTRVAEFHYLHHAADGKPYADVAEMAMRIAAASAETGIGLTLLPVFYAHGGFGAQEPTEGQRRFVTTLDGYARLHDASRSAIARLPGAEIGIAPHSLRATTLEELGELAALDRAGPIHIHIAEQIKEVDDCLAWCGRRPIERLLATGLPDRRWCFVHATHATPEEISGMAAAGVVAGLCPITEANLGDGIFDMPGFLAAGGRFGVGSDSNVLIDLAGELRQLEYSQRLGLRSRNIVSTREGQSTGRALLEGALAGGGLAVGTKSCGLAVGAAADLIVLDTRHIALAGRENDALLDSWIFAARKSPIREVWCNGRRLVAEGRHLRRNSIQRRAGAVIAKMAS